MLLDCLAKYSTFGGLNSPLHFAAAKGHNQIVSLLLQTAADANSRLPEQIISVGGQLFILHGTIPTVGTPLLTPNSEAAIPRFPSSNCLSLPLLSVLNIAREIGLQAVTVSSDENDVCAVCLEKPCSVAAEGCGHELCVRCALYLCSTSSTTPEMAGPPGSIPRPLCRHGIISFAKLPGSAVKGIKQPMSLGLCTHAFFTLATRHQAGHQTSGRIAWRLFLQIYSANRY